MLHKQRNETTKNYPRIYIFWYLIPSNLSLIIMSLKESNCVCLTYIRVYDKINKRKIIKKAVMIDTHKMLSFESFVLLKFICICDPSNFIYWHDDSLSKFHVHVLLMKNMIVTKLNTKSKYIEKKRSER